MDRQCILNRIQVGNSELLDLLYHVWELTDYLNAGNTLPDAPQSSVDDDGFVASLRPQPVVESLDAPHVVRQKGQ